VLYQPMGRNHLAKAGLLRINDGNNSASTVPNPLNRAVSRLTLSASNSKVHGGSSSSSGGGGGSLTPPEEDQPIRRMATKGASFSAALASFTRSPESEVSIVVGFI